MDEDGDALGRGAQQTRVDLHGLKVVLRASPRQPFGWTAV
jgi:hypothetical protein